MTALEREIYHYLQHRSGEHIPIQEISRRIGGPRRFHCAHGCAKLVLMRMTERGILEYDAEGRYRIKPMPQKETEGKRWASPQIARLLHQRGKNFDNVITTDSEDAYYEKL